MTAHKNIYVALAAAQAQFSAVIKDSTNPAFRSKYADLSSVVTAVAPALSENGIAFFHSVEDGQMVTILYHGESDTSVRCAVPLIVNKNDMQGFKSACTYAKRIGLESVTGVAPEDDDGNAAATAAPRQPAGPSDAAIEKAITNLTDAENIDELVAVWNNLRTNQPLLARNEKVIAAKDARKEMLYGGFGEEVAAQ